MKAISLILGALFLSQLACAHANPVVIAHRGASGYLPEHSLPAVSAAHMLDVDYIEQDVVLSKDNIPVVLHDIHLETVTDAEKVFPKRARKDGRYYAIDFTLKELKRLSLNERTRPDGSAVFPGRFPIQSTGLKIPTLEEEIQLIKGMNKSRKKDIGLYVELKKPKFHREHNADIEDVVLEVLAKNGYSKKSDRIFLQCFEKATLLSLKEKTELKLVQLIGINSWKEADTDYEAMMTRSGLENVSQYADGIGPYIGSFLGKENASNRGLLKFARELKLEIHPYTFRNDQLPEGFNDMKSLVLFFKNLGVTGFFADHPDAVQRVLEKR